MRLISRFFRLLWFMSLIRGVLRMGRRGGLLATVAVLAGTGGCGTASHLVAGVRDAAAGLTRTFELPAGGGRLGALARSPGVPLERVTRHDGCHVVAARPDRACSPGAILPTVGTADICRRGFTRQIRNVSYEEKGAIYAAYGIGHRFNGSDGEVDHIVPLELGGSNGEANLFPQSAAGALGAHEKDQLENRLNELVCRGRLQLRTAQEAIASDWVAAFRRYVAR